MGVGLGHEASAGGEAQRTDIGDHLGVVCGIDHDCHALVVLGRRAHHRWAADIDILDSIFQCHIGVGDGLGEGVEVHDNEVDGANPVLRDGRHVLRLVAVGEDASVDLGVEGLDPAFQHLGEARELVDGAHRQSCILERLCGASRGDQLHPCRRQRLRKFHDPRLVRNRDQGTINLYVFHGKHCTAQGNG